MPRGPSSSPRRRSSSKKKRTAKKYTVEEDGVGLEYGLASAPASKSRRKAAAGIKEYKIAVCGAAGSGKSTFITKYVNRRLKTAANQPFAAHGALLPVTNWKKRVDIEGKVHVVDLHEFTPPSAGDYSARIDSVEIRDADGVILLYDITNRASFDETIRIYEYVMRVRKDSPFVLVLIGNFVDKESNRQVLTLEGKDLADGFECPFFEMTATSRKVVTAAISECLSMIREMPEPVPSLVGGGEIGVRKVSSARRSFRQSSKTFAAAMASRHDAADIKFGPAREVADGPKPPPEIKAGSLERLVERLTYDKYVDIEYQRQFMLTFTTFTTPQELLGLLEARYTNAAPVKKGWSREQGKSAPVRVRVLDLLVYWVDTYYQELAEEPALLDRITTFAKTSMSDVEYHLLLDVISYHRKHPGAPPRSRPDQPLTGKPPKALVPKVNANGVARFIDMDPAEVARQMTLIESALFRSLRASEFMGQAWNRDGKDKLAPVITKLTRRFNSVSRWVATAVVKLTSVKGRVFIITRMLEIAQLLRQMNNFNGMMEIMSGLNNTAVHRLKRTWKYVPGKWLVVFTDLKKLAAYRGNFSAYRQALRELPPNESAIPFLGVFLTDLTFIEDGNRDMSGALINFEKRRKLAQVVSFLLDFQPRRYNFTPVPVIADYLTQITGVSDDALYRISCQREPPATVAAVRGISTPAREVTPARDTMTKLLPYRTAEDQGANLDDDDRKKLEATHKTLSKSIAAANEALAMTSAGGGGANGGHGSDKDSSGGGKRRGPSTGAKKILSARDTMHQLDDVASNSKGDSRAGVWTSWVKRLQTDTGKYRQSSGKDARHLTFTEVFQRSRALELTLESVLHDFPTNAKHVDTLQQLLHCTLLGDHALHTQLMQGIGALAGRQLEGNWIRLVVSGLALLKIAPLPPLLVKQLQRVDAIIQDMEASFQEMEMREGANSLMLNRDKLTCTAQLMKLYAAKRRIVREGQPDRTGLRRAAFFHAAVWDDLQDNVRRTAGTSDVPAPSLTREISVKDVHEGLFRDFNARAKDAAASLTMEFLVLLRAMLRALAFEDDAHMTTALNSATSSYTIMLDCHLQYLVDQMVLLTNRLQRMTKFREETTSAISDALDPTTPNLVNQVDKVIREDLAEFRVLLSDIDAMEAKIQAAGDAGSDKNSKATAILMTILELRSMQQLIEDMCDLTTVPEQADLADLTGESTLRTKGEMDF